MQYSDFIFCILVICDYIVIIKHKVHINRMINIITSCNLIKWCIYILIYYIVQYPISNLSFEPVWLHLENSESIFTDIRFYLSITIIVIYALIIYQCIVYSLLDNPFEKVICSSVWQYLSSFYRRTATENHNLLCATGQWNTNTVNHTIKTVDIISNN